MAATTGISRCLLFSVATAYIRAHCKNSNSSPPKNQEVEAKPSACSSHNLSTFEGFMALHWQWMHSGTHLAPDMPQAPCPASPDWKHYMKTDRECAIAEMQMRGSLTGSEWEGHISQIIWLAVLRGKLALLPPSSRPFGVLFPSRLTVGITSLRTQNICSSNQNANVLSPCVMS